MCTVNSMTLRAPPCIIIKQKSENMPNDRCGNTTGQKCNAKGTGKEIKYKSLGTEIQRM